MAIEPAADVCPAGRHRRRRLRGHRGAAGLDRLRDARDATRAVVARHAPARARRRRRRIAGCSSRPALDWYPYLGGPQAPTPAAAGPPGAWRSVSGQRFVLAEVPLATAHVRVGCRRRRSGDPPDRVEGRGRRVRLAGRHAAARPGYADGVVGAVAGLHRDRRPTRVPVREHGRRGVRRDDPAGGDAGTNGATPSSQPDQFDLRGSVLAPDGVVVDRWIVTAAALDASGSISDPVQVTAVVDLAPPAVTPRRAAAESTVAVRGDASWHDRGRVVGLTAGRFAGRRGLRRIVRAPGAIRAVATDVRGHRRRCGGERDGRAGVGDGRRGSPGLAVAGDRRVDRAARSRAELDARRPTPAASKRRRPVPQRRSTPIMAR